MEANFFRVLAEELREQLESARINKIFSPVAGVWTFAITTRTGKRFLLLRHGKPGGLLFFSALKPENPLQPGARVMWFRKRVLNRRIVAIHADWTRLRLALELAGTSTDYLIFDLREGLSLKDTLDDGFSEEPLWPTWQQAMEPEAWRRYPQLSPPLRKTLNVLPADLGQALLHELENGTASSFYVALARDGSPTDPVVWPIFDAPGDVEVFDTAMAASTRVGEPLLYPEFEREARKEERERIKAAKKAVKRRLSHVERDRERLQKMLDNAEQAKLLQAVLYQYKDMETPESILVQTEQGEVEIELNVHLSVQENMELLFKQAAKGRRGLGIVEERREQLEQELANIRPMPGNERKARTREVAPDVPKRYQTLAVRLFVSSDGYLLARGKNARANHELLSKAASPHDYWFHAKDVPGAHVILKRDHPSQDVPEQSLLEAAALAGLSSPFKDAGRAEVMCALVKDVRKIKGAGHGQVRVDELQQVISAPLDEALEERLEYKSVANELTSD